MSAGSPSVSLATSPAEREEIYRFRYQIYVEEMGKSPPEADHRCRLFRDSFDGDSRLYALRDVDGALVGTLRLNRLCELDCPDEALKPIPMQPLLNHAPIETLSYTSRLMLRRDWRGGGGVALLFNRCFGDALQSGVRFDLCHANPGLVELYEQLGYRRFTCGVSLVGAGYQVPMLLALRDREHFRRSRSPLMRHPLLKTCEFEDRQGDGYWLDGQSSRYWGLNHRLVNPDQFWEQVGVALCQSKQVIPLLKGLDTQQARRLLKTGTVLYCMAGDRIVSQGESRQDLFVVMDGYAEVSRHENGHRLGLALLQPGDVFGEMGFLGCQQRSADVVAETDVKVLVLTQAFLKKAMSTQPEAMAIVLRNLSLVLSERLAGTTDRLWQLSRETQRTQ